MPPESLVQRPLIGPLASTAIVCCAIVLVAVISYAAGYLSATINAVAFRGEVSMVEMGAVVEPESTVSPERQEVPADQSQTP